MAKEQKLMLTMRVKLNPTPEQVAFLECASAEFVSLVNDVVSYYLGQGKILPLTTAMVKAPLLPSAVINQALREAKSVYHKSVKKHVLSVLRKPKVEWNNQNFGLLPDGISVPFMVKKDGKLKSSRIIIQALFVGDQLDFLQNHKLGSLRVSKKNGKYFAQISYEPIVDGPSSADGIMGIDLGIKCPAVAVTSSGAVKFYGNGRQRRMVRRRFFARRKKLGKAKKLRALKKTKDKEKRWMRDQDHKISRAIVDYAKEHGIGVIQMETLEGIRKHCTLPTCKSRKNKSNRAKAKNRSINNWSFYRLQEFIEYKARLVGIVIQYVNPAYTSQACPQCGQRHHANDRRYVCPSCGFRTHRDIVGATNICRSSDIKAVA